MIRLLRRHKPCPECYARGFYEAARIAKLRDDAERALRNVRLSDAQMAEMVALRDGYQGGGS